MLFGKCNNPFGHGHNYTLQVTVSGPIDADTGMVVNLTDLDAFADRELIECFDQVNLSTLDVFREAVPSTENLCIVLWHVFARFAAQHAPVRLQRVRVEETSNNAFDYFGEGSPMPSFE